jgi:adenylate cyclase
VSNLTLFRLDGSLFAKYLVTVFATIIIPIVLSALFDSWFGYWDQNVYMNQLLTTQAQSARDQIQTYVDSIHKELGFSVQFPWDERRDEIHRIDALRLLGQVPAITSILLVDGADIERVFVSRVGLDKMGEGTDMSTNPAVVGAHNNGIWYGPIQFQDASEPHMMIAAAGTRKSVGVAVADINLKLMWDVIAKIKIGKTGYAYILDGNGRIIAHPDISRVLREETRRSQVRADPNAILSNEDGVPVFSVSVPSIAMGWTVIALLPVSEALAPIRALLWRTLALIAIGALFASVLAYLLAAQMSGPIRELEKGVRKIGVGQFNHRIDVRRRDELGSLAKSFNQMAEELSSSAQKTQRINRLKEFLAPQVAELLDHTGGEVLLRGQRREIVVVFGDLRGFTAFSASHGADIVLGLLGEYYDAVGRVVTRHEATLIGFSGDGVMALVNAPVACLEPALRAVRLAIDMQAAVQATSLGWSTRGFSIGFGVGLAMGEATVGTVGFEGHMEYTAIGPVVNLAFRLCASAQDAEILLDPVVAKAVMSDVPLVSLGERQLRGFADPLEVFSISDTQVDKIKRMSPS